jgi:hypothetical protein
VIVRHQVAKRSRDEQIRLPALAFPQHVDRLPEESHNICGTRPHLAGFFNKPMGLV